MISLVCTVLNEKESIARWLQSIMAQTVLPGEIVIVDGGSTDGTWEWLESEKANNPLLRVFRDPGTISHGRNRAIAEATGDSIAVTDAGCTYDPSWFAKLTAPLAAGTARSSATGFGPGLHRGDSPRMIALASATTPAPYEFSRDWLPSSRSVAFSKELCHTVGGYPEWLAYSEDLVFDLALQRKTPFQYIREPLVFWRPRTTLGAYWRQLRQYAASQVYAGLFPVRHALRLFSFLVGSWLLYQKHYLVVLVAMLCYQYRYLRRAHTFAQSYTVSTKSATFILVPWVVLLGECAKLYGSLVGAGQRLRAPRRINNNAM